MQSKLKVLTVEDALDMGQESLEIFKQYSMELSFLPRDGYKIIEVIENNSPDVVIINLFMPRIDAIGIMTTIRRNRKIEMPMFIVVSSFGRFGLEKEVLDAGASHFIVKPVTTEQLIEKIFRINYKFKLNSSFNDTNFYDINPENIELKVTETLHQIGVPAHIKGYQYLRDSIKLSIENPLMINAITKQLYPSVATNFQSTPSRVERAIRHAIEVAWDRGDIDILNHYFGYTIHNSRGKPTNSEFIAMISDKLRLELKSAS